MTMKIRPAHLNDYEDFCELSAQIDGLHRAQHPDIFRDPGDVIRTSEYFAELLNDDSQHILLAEIDGKAVGAIQWVVTYAKEIPILHPRTAIMIDMLVVHNEYQRRGIGRKLMAEVEQWAQDHDIVNVELGVWMFNESAIKFYESLGYHIYRARMIHELDK